jgi:hypothetical protein
MKYDWKEAGEEWSEPWGSSAAQWTKTTKIDSVTAFLYHAVSQSVGRNHFRNYG